MKMRLGIGIGSAAVVLAVAGAGFWANSRSREPVFQGKELSVWLRGYGGNGPSPETDEVVRKIGTNAIPTLPPWLRNRLVRLEALLFLFFGKKE